MPSICQAEKKGQLAAAADSLLKAQQVRPRLKLFQSCLDELQDLQLAKQQRLSEKERTRFASVSSICLEFNFPILSCLGGRRHLSRTLSGCKLLSLE